MQVELSFKNGHRERRLCSPETRLLDLVQEAEEQASSKIQTIRVIKRREHQHRGNDQAERP